MHTVTIPLYTLWVTCIRIQQLYVIDETEGVYISILQLYPDQMQLNCIQLYGTIKCPLVITSILIDNTH